MRRAFLSLLCPLLVVNWWLSCPQAQAETIRQIKSQELANPISVPLAPGYGVSLSWIGTNEQIMKVWLDNPTFATLSVDGCLQGLDSNNCRTNQAQVLHLKRIEPLQLPGVIETSSSLLTVLTSSNQLYLFKLSKANTPSALILQFAPLPTEISFKPRPNVDWLLVAAIDRGINKALIAQTLQQNSQLYQQLRQFQALLQQGESESVAQQQAGISWEIVSKLKQLGNFSNQ